MKINILISSLLILTASALEARTVSWFNAAGDGMFDSSNRAIGTDVTFELGTFGTFVPNSSNLQHWAENWKVFDRAVSGDGWNAGTQFLSSSAQFLADGTSSFGGPHTFLTGDVMYLWAYTSQDLLTTSDWALIRGSSSPVWTLPASDTSNTNHINWDLIDADTAIYGGINGSYGGGTLSTYADPGFVLQLAAVPEPSGALLAFLALLPLLRRRR